MSALLDKAITLAVRAHGGQLDKGGQPYILHPLRVMLAGITETEQIVGVLHDVVEDAHTPVDLLRDYFGSIITDAILSVSRNDGEVYIDFIWRAKQNSIGRIIKIRDIQDNLNPTRLRAIPVHEWGGMQRRYERALCVLLS